MGRGARGEWAPGRLAALDDDDAARATNAGKVRASAPPSRAASPTSARAVGPASSAQGIARELLVDRP